MIKKLAYAPQETPVIKRFLQELNAVVENLEFARRQAIVPIKASHFARIANGFYRTRFVPLDGRRWRVEDRGALQTIRFDRASLTTVDFARSAGVVGARVRTHTSTLLELQVAHYKSTKWLRWWRVTERNLWTMRRNKSALLLQQIGANLKN